MTQERAHHFITFLETGNVPLDCSRQMSSRSIPNSVCAR